jgi:hypothetical protein
MEIKQGSEIVFICKNSEREFKFSCEPSSTLGEIHDALFLMRAQVIEMMKAQNPNPSEEKKECNDSNC